MELEPYLRAQARLHPSLFPVDVAKACYQAAYGAEHLLGDIPKAHVSFLREFEACRPMDVPLVEAISDEVARVSSLMEIPRHLAGKIVFAVYAKRFRPAIRSGTEHYRISRRSEKACR